MEKLLETAELAGYENMTYQLKNDGVLDLRDWVNDMVEETVRVVIDNETIYMDRERDLWEQLGEPDPEFLDHCNSISHAIGMAVGEALYYNGDVHDAVKDGAARALTEWAWRQGVCTGPGDTIEELLEVLGL